MEVEVKIYKNKFTLETKARSATVTSEKPFTTTRLIVGTFMPAVKCLKQGLKEIGAIGFFKSKPVLNLKPQIMNDGGLSEVEERCLQELGFACGAKKVNVSV